MLAPQAESTFQKGVELLRRGLLREALPFLKAAVDLNDGRSENHAGQARYESYYGLCLSMSPGRLHDGLEHCRTAARAEPYRPDVWLNLGRVALAAGRRGEAFRALDRGRCLDPGHAGIAKELRRLGQRRRPIVRFLRRHNPVNIFLGRLLTT